MKAKNIKKIDRTNLASTAGDILDAFISIGARGVYDPESTVGSVDINGTTVQFSTGHEQVHITIEKISSHNPKNTILALKKFLQTVSDY